jgi:hypothetical protein
MNTTQLAMLAALSMAFFSCKKDDDEGDDHAHDHDATIQMQFNFMHGSNSFDQNMNYTDGAGHAIRFSALKFYASDFHLEDDAGTTVADYHSKAILADGSNPTAVFPLGTMGHGHIHEVHFSLGLDSATNHTTDPTSAPYPLNLAGMHWSWNPAAGYKFLLMEGLVDGNADGDLDDTEDVAFVYHCATDALLRTDHALIHADVDGGTVTLMAKVDVATLVSGLDFLAVPIAMGGEPTNIAAMDSLVSAIDAL